MKKLFLTLLLSFSATVPAVVSAEAMVLVQGYLGDNDSWRRSGVTTALVHAGWRDGGHLVDGPSGIKRNGPSGKGAKQFYTLALPTEAPMLVQARLMERYMNHVLVQHQGESLYLVGHSAGGVLARLYMVQHPKVRVSALITMASPHLGTGTAEAGVMAGQSPLGWIAPFVGAQELNRSQGLYYDLSREQTGNLLYWLNRQPHPKSRYVSVVHKDGGFLGMGNLLVPDWSQNMNNVIALRGSAVAVPVSGDHPLSPADGALLVDLIRRMQAS